MAFSTLRGRPRKPVNDNDLGTPELRLKHAMQLTAEPIDICLEKGLITPRQHWCGLHLRWLYTLRYGAPCLTTRYTDPGLPASTPSTDDPAWRSMREREYTDAIRLLKTARQYECVLRLCVFNEHPTFIDPRLLARARQNQQLSEQLSASRITLRDGLETLSFHWTTPAARTPSILNCNNE